MQKIKLPAIHFEWAIKFIKNGLKNTMKESKDEPQHAIKIIIKKGAIKAPF